MPISQAEAASALRDIDETTARTMEMRAYREASPYLLLWGLVWAAGYGLMGLLPADQWGLLWLPLDLAGVAASVAIGCRARRRAASRGAAARANLLPMLATVFFTTLFVMAVYVLFAPTRHEPYLVFPALVVGLIYVVLGAWKMRRLAWIGAAMFLLAMAGFLFLRPWLPFWLAAVGGGGLVAGGLWLRKV
ncbi:MAG TPA: hypothetical protein VF727_07900 [Allosphingosinicella sp.]